jgi:hypothetical protein
VVLVEQRSPARVAENLDLLGGANEVGRDNGGQNAVRDPCRPRPGEELLDLVEDLVGVDGDGDGDGDEVIVSREHDEPRTRNVPGEVAALLDVDIEVACAMENERRAGRSEAAPARRPSSS